MTVTDTQVLSYYFKGAAVIPGAPILISSITAAEFLLIQAKNKSGANYYPMLPSMFRHVGGSRLGGGFDFPRIFESKKHAAFGKRRTDQLVLNFSGKMPSFVEYGGVAISQIINDRHEGLFFASIAHLDKELQRKLREKLRFLIGANVQCLAVTPAIAEVAMNILARFLDKYEAKQNPRNTINDILILSTAIQHALPLLTEDGLLKRFAAELLGARCYQPAPNRLLIDFTMPELGDRRKPLESKGYINRGWQILERRGIR